MPLLEPSETPIRRPRRPRPVLQPADSQPVQPAAGLASGDTSSDWRTRLAPWLERQAQAVKAGIARLTPSSETGSTHTGLREWIAGLGERMTRSRRRQRRPSLRRHSQSSTEAVGTSKLEDGQPDANYSLGRVENSRLSSDDSAERIPVRTLNRQRVGGAERFTSGRSVPAALPPFQSSGSAWRSAGMAVPSASNAGQTSTRLHIDVPLMLVTITLIVFGLLMAYSASADFSFEANNGDATFIFRRQLLFLGLGLAAAVVAALIDYHYWQKLAVLGMAASLLSLVVVLFIGEERHGAVRTLFGGSVQPSELAKVVTILYLAVWLYAKRDRLHDISFGLIPLGVILGFVGGLISVQPDLSAVLTVFMIGGLLFFLAGGDLKQIAIVLLLALVVGLLVAASGGLTGTGGDRIQSFMAGWENPLNASYHVQRALEALVKGGLFGVGIGNADTKLTGLPVPHTDSIYAVVGEETGILGAAMVALLYGLLLWRGLTVAQRAPDGLGRLLAAGLTLWLVMEAFINMAVMVGLMPFAGNALPFMSVGGSNLMMSLVEIGIILNVSRLS